VRDFSGVGSLLLILEIEEKYEMGDEKKLILFPRGEVKPLYCGITV